MRQANELVNRRILMVDDEVALQRVFARIFERCKPKFELDLASQGLGGLDLVKQALKAGEPYAVAFIDVRMAPGIDGVETVERMWKVDPDLQVVLCSGYNDYDFKSLTQRLDRHAQILFLMKPYSPLEIRQLALALADKWQLTRLASDRYETQAQCLGDTEHLLEKTHLQLQEADKMASIGQLAAGLAHEINNPIAFVYSNLSSLRQYIDGFKRILAEHQQLADSCMNQPKLADMAIRLRRHSEELELDYILSDVDGLLTDSLEGAERVREIVADLRDFSLVDSSNLVETDLNQLIDKAVNLACNETKCTAEVIREFAELPLINSYSGRLGQVILNLLVNAAQSIADRGTITLRTGEHGDRVWLEIVDDGCGITPENLERIFDPFFTTKACGGTGLGLHLAGQIVEAHDGTLKATSEVGRGTTFRLTLPIAGPKTRNKDEAAQPSHATSGELS